MSNAPIILTLDCDMQSNDPKTPLRAICYLSDPSISSLTACVQFPQRFRGINKNDIYACEHQRVVEIQAMGFDGLQGPNYIGSGCFFRRRAFFGSPSSPMELESHDLYPTYVVNKPIKSQSILERAHYFASCSYENKATNWGHKFGVRYGSLAEDYYTGYRMQCEGWKSIFCNPERVAFYGNSPICLIDVLSQQTRWAVGLLEVGFSRYSPITFGLKKFWMLMALCYSQIAFWPIWSVPITIYAFFPQLALLNNVFLFPKVSEHLFLVYAFLFVGSYGQDCLDFILTGRSIQRWWNDQRMWHVRGLTCYLFGLTKYVLKSLGISEFGFNVTSKLQDKKLSQRYEQGIFEFGVHSPMFGSLTVSALINLISFVHGLGLVIGGQARIEWIFVQVCLAGFVVVNCWPIFEAMVLRSDKGKLPVKTPITSICLTLALYVVPSLFFFTN